MASVAVTIGASVISTLLKPMVDKAVAEAVDQCFVAVNIKEEMSNLRNTLCMIEGAIPEAEEKKDNNPIIRDWLRKLNDICYEARDMLDEFVTISASSRAKRDSKQVIPLPLRFRLANKIRRFRKRLDGMKKDMETAHLLKFARVGDSQNAPISCRPETGPSLDNQRDLFVGREVQKEMIMNKLLNYKDDHVHVVPIWGMGGVGKTTLAQSVYNDGNVTKEIYPSKKWLCVGETKFNAKEIILKITNDSNTNDVEVCQEKLKEKLKRGRFLIVLDDVWNIDRNEWELFWNPLTGIGKGGHIIITTRKRDVISAIGTPVPDDLKPLDNEDSWQIFQSHAFNNVNSCTDLERKKDIGKQIVKKLNGIPLALKVVGSSLLNEINVETWRYFLRYHEWMPSQNDNGIKSALRWSYDHLSSRLKHCFAYCSLFPKDHEFDHKMLVQMWIAHGFIENVGAGAGGREKKRPEDIGAEYFKQLVNASLFQRVNDKYKMHDLIHELAVLVSTDEIVNTNDLLSSEQMEKARHVSIISATNYWENLRMCNTKRLLTLYSRNDRYSYNFYSGWIPEPSECKNIFQGIFKQLKSLRVLVLDSKEITYIPDCISELIHLRYLNIYWTSVRTIPDSLCDLYNLQVLLVPVGLYYYASTPVAVLPKNIVNMTNLRHLRACLTTSKGVKNLASLQQLYSINICKNDNISELGDMTQLRGELIIKGLENVTSSQDATQARMQDKIYLKRLSLVFTKGLENTDVQAEVLDALQCPPNLTDLTIDGYNGLTSPCWIQVANVMGSLSKLILNNCHGLVVLELGVLVSVRYLKIINCSKLTRVTSVVHVAATVELFSNDQCQKLEKKEFESLFSIKTLEIRGCKELMSFPRLLAIEDLEVSGCKRLRSLSISLQGWDSLQRLEVRNCPMLEEVFEDNAPTSSSSTLSSLPPSRLRNLRTDNMFVFSKLFEHGLNLLKFLAISRCDDDLPPYIHKLPSLKYLHLYDCRKLKALPDDGLPPSLEHLLIAGCPLLYERCEEVSGLDWHKIKHIREREIYREDSDFLKHSHEREIEMAFQRMFGGLR